MISFDLPGPQGRPVQCQLSVRTDKPVAGASLVPVVSLRNSAGLALDMKCRWFRSPLSMICSNSACPSLCGQDSDNIVSPRIVCSICLGAGVPRSSSQFCSGSCFREVWAEHKQLHYSLLPKPQRGSESLFHSEHTRCTDATGAVDAMWIEVARDMYSNVLYIFFEIQSLRRMLAHQLWIYLYKAAVMNQLLMILADCCGSTARL